ncbi:MAG TPA: hypothetical protein VKI44_13850 [Acetobacteraceae bacterium]|nr:hypothetical protein [Acetobacteraceae bacterium]
MVSLGCGHLVAEGEHFLMRLGRLLPGSGGFGFDLGELGPHRFDLFAERGQVVRGVV